MTATLDDIVCLAQQKLSFLQRENFVMFWSRTLIPLYISNCSSKKSVDFFYSYKRLFLLFLLYSFWWKEKKKYTNNGTIMSIWDSLTSCFWFSPENQRNTFASILAGVLVNRQMVYMMKKITQTHSTMSHKFITTLINRNAIMWIIST